MGCSQGVRRLKQMTVAVVVVIVVMNARGRDVMLRVIYSFGDYWCSMCTGRKMGYTTD